VVMRAAASKILIAAAVVFAAINLNNALHKGGDFEVFLQAGDRVRYAQPLYEGSWPGGGVLGPPFQGVFFVPFAALASVSAVAARVLWYAIGLSALAFGIVAWSRVDVSRRTMSWAALWSSPAVIWPALAIALPAETNFEHQNMNPVLLALTGFGALALAKRQDTTAGICVGIAAALKAFPALLIGYFVVVRAWRAAATALVVSAALTLSPMLFYGPSGAMETLRAWTAIGHTGEWPSRPQNQSLLAFWLRLGLEPSTAHMAFAVSAIVTVLLVWWGTRSRPADGPAGQRLAMAPSLAAAVLASPIAWDHYWVLMFPALQACYSAGAFLPFWTGAVLITGLSPLTVGTHGFALVRSWSNSAIAGLILAGSAAWNGPYKKKRPA